MYQRILVALDGSPTSEKALSEAVRVADTDSQIIAITVVENPLIGELPPIMAYDYAVLHDAFLQQSKNILDKAQRDMQEQHQIHIETHIIDMNPNSIHDLAQVIQDNAKKYQADLIVIGTHGRKGVKRFFLGSIAEQVIRQSQLPVLIVRDQTLQESA